MRVSCQAVPGWRLRLLASLIIGGAVTLPEFSALAQIQPDSTLGANNSVVDSGVNINGRQGELIEGGLRRRANLYHSFDKFNVNENQRIYFNNPTGVDIILTRVTGNSPSNILGTLGVWDRTNNTLGNADLFLINPNGIIFGSNSSLDLNGSFLATTAQSVIFEDGTQFSTLSPQIPQILTVSVPIGLQFGTTPGSIVNQSQVLNPPIGLQGLAVNQGRTLALIGGDLTLQGGGLTAPAGRIELGSVGGNSQVDLQRSGKGWVLGYGNVQRFEDIHLNQRATVATVSEVGGGDIHLQAREITLSEGSQIQSVSLGAERGGDIIVNASESVELTGRSPVDSNVSSGLFSIAVAQGRAGNITIKTRRLTVENGATISTESSGTQEEPESATGQAGNLSVYATDSVRLNNSSQLRTTTSGSGNAGNIDIETGQLVVQDSIILASTSGQGQGGKLTVNANSIKLAGIFTDTDNNAFSSGLFTTTINSGNAGSTNVNAARLVIRDGAQISASSEGQGSPGLIDINAGAIQLDNNGKISSTLGAEATSGGEITVNARSFTASNGGNVSTTTSSTRNGNAGNITFRILDDLTLTGAGSGIFASTNPGSNGVGGDINIDPQTVTIADGARISVDSQGQGNAGNIRLQAESLTLNQGAISATTTSGEGGNLFLEVRDLLLLRNNSQISTNAGGTGNGGNITIAAQFIVANPFENSDITANAFAGRGGNINIRTQGLFGIEPRVRLTPLSDITASSELGVRGTIAINSPEVDPNRGTTELPQTFAAPPILQGCQAGNPQAASSFVDVGRGGLPPNPVETLSDEAVWQDLRPIAPASSDRRQATQRQSKRHSEPLSASVTEPIVEAQGWLIDARGQVVLTAAAPTATPHRSGFSPATCKPG
jgi:filamentous hemagglutinin family protein